MNSSRRTILLFFFVVLILPVLLPSPAQPVQAQTKSCPDIVTAALNATNKECSRTGRNKVCYGNTQIDIEAQPNAAKFTFGKPGDIANVNALKTLRLGALVVDNNQWGIAVMRIQANLPDTAPGQNVTMLLFGDVQIDDASKVASAGTPVATDAAATVAATATKAAKPAKTATPAAKYKPMQAFYFRGGVGESACQEAPPDGILIQSPQGKQKIELSVNEVQIELGSTLFLQAQPSKEMIVNTVEGAANVTAFGKTEIAVAGTRVRVPLDANLKAAGTPTPPEGYDTRPFVHLPLRILPRAIGIKSPPIPATAIVSTWHLVELTKTVGGAPDCRVNPPLPPADLSLAMDVNGTSMWFAGEVFYQTTPGLYVSDYPYFDALDHTEIRFTSATHADIQLTGTIPGCTLHSTLTIDKLAAATAAPTGAATVVATAAATR